MRRFVPVLLAAILSQVLYACSEGDSAAPAATVRDSAGIRVVTYDLTETPIPTYRTVGEHDLEIGVRNGQPEYTFSRIPDVVLGPDETLVVSDGVAQELRVFDREGAFQHTIGRGGDGPGEFASAPVVAGVGGDTVFAYDGRSRRLTMFSLAGEMLENMTLRPDAGGRYLVTIRQDDGTYLGQSRWVDPDRSMGELHDVRLELDSIAIQRLHPDGTVIDTLRVMPDMNIARSIQGGAGGTIRLLQASPPYTPRAFLRSDGSRIVIGRSDAFELHLAGDGSEAETILRVLGVDHPATHDEIVAHQEAVLREEAGGGEIDPRSRTLNLEFLPERLPAFAAVSMSEAGDIWVAITEFDGSEGYDWLVFSRSGEFRGKVHTPPDMRLHEIRPDYIIGVITDEFDVPYVRRYPLVEEAAASG